MNTTERQRDESIETLSQALTLLRNVDSLDVSTRDGAKLSGHADAYLLTADDCIAAAIDALSNIKFENAKEVKRG